MRGFIIPVLIALFMGACGNNAGKNKGNEGGEFRMLVNDSVIALGDVHKITFPLMWYFGFPKDEKAQNETMAQYSFTKSQVMVYAVEQYMDEVNAGGHYQFFSDPSGILWKDASAGLQKMGLNEYQNILDTVISKMGGDPSPDLQQRNMLIDSLDLSFSREDNLFFELRKKRDPSPMIMQFVKANKSEFYFDRMVKKPN